MSSGSMGAVIEMVGGWVGASTAGTASEDCGGSEDPGSEAPVFEVSELDESGGWDSCRFDKGVSSASSEGCRFREPVMYPYMVRLVK